MSERGAVHLTLVALFFGSMLMLGLAMDMARFAGAWREAAHLAATAAETGAGWIDEEAARRDILMVDVAKADDAARAVASGGTRRVEVNATPDRVCVTVTIVVRPTLLTLAGAGPRSAAATSCAEPRMG